MPETIATTGDGSILTAGDGSALVFNVETVTRVMPFCAYSFTRDKNNRAKIDWFRKSDFEEFFISCSMLYVLSSDETVDSGDITVLDKNGVNFTSEILIAESISFDGQSNIAIKVRGGSKENLWYSIIFKVVTSDGNKFQNTIQMVIL